MFNTGKDDFDQWIACKHLFAGQKTQHPYNPLYPHCPTWTLFYYTEMHIQLNFLRFFNVATSHGISLVYLAFIITCMLTLESWRFPVLGEVSFCVRTLLNCKRNKVRSYYYIVYYIVYTKVYTPTHSVFWELCPMHKDN